MRKMHKLLAIGLGLALALTLAGPANAVLITFDEFVVGTSISNQYAALGVIFSAGPDHTSELPFIINDGGAFTSLLPGEGGDFTMSFLNPVNCLEFDAGVWDDVGTAIIDVYDPWGNFISSVTNVTANPGVFNYEHFDLSGLGLIGYVRFDSYHDVASAAMDNLEFCPVPEPGTIALLGIGLAGVAARRRRNRKS